VIHGGRPLFSGWPHLTQNEGAVNGFLKPHLLQMIGSLGLVRRANLIQVTRAEIISVAASPISRSGLWTDVIVVVAVAADWGRVVVYDVDCVFVLVLVNMPVTVEVPVSARTISMVVVFVISSVAVPVITEV
jgi:hypothetical protein